jgi:iron complex transport system substrate-binding protein
MGTVIEGAGEQMRIVTLLPSATEMVCALGLRDQLVGVTHECDFPESVLTLSKVTRTFIPRDASSTQIDAMVRERARSRAPLYQLDAPKLSELRPDLIVTQGLCDVCAVDETEVQQAACAMHWGPQVINLEPMSLRDVFEAMRTVAWAAGVRDKGSVAIRELSQRAERIADRSARISARPTVVFLEWLDPLFCGGHWNPQLVELAGGKELIGRAGMRSRRIEWDEVQHADPDVIYIACCGFSADRAIADLPSLKRKPGWAELKAVKNDRVFVADGSAYFNRPGPRLVDSLEILAASIHPGDWHRGQPHLKILDDRLNGSTNPSHEMRPPLGACAAD